MDLLQDPFEIFLKEVLLGAPQDQYGFLGGLLEGVSYLFQVNQWWALQLKVLVVGFYFQGL